LTSKLIYGKYHSVPCKFIITEDNIKEAQEAMAYLNGCKWNGYLQVMVKPVKIYHENAKELLSAIEAYLYIEKAFIGLCYDGYEGVEYITDMQDITKLPDIWASDSFLDNLTNKYGGCIIDKRLLSAEDKENLRHITIMYKLEEST
jgi:hypothetical protein